MKHSSRATSTLVAHEQMLRKAMLTNSSSALVERHFDICAELHRRGYIVMEARPYSPRNRRIMLAAIAALCISASGYVYMKWPSPSAPVQRELTPQERIDQAWQAMGLHSKGFREER